MSKEVWLQSLVLIFSLLERHTDCILMSNAYCQGDNQKKQASNYHLLASYQLSFSV